MNKIFLGLVLIAIGYGLSLAAKLIKPKANNVKDNESTKVVDLSSFDLILYIPTPKKDIKDILLKSLNTYGLICEIHPEFDFNNQSGFLPFKLRIDSSNEHLESNIYTDKEMLSGFELNISEFNSKEYFEPWSQDDLKSMESTFKREMDKCKYELLFSVKPSQNITEYRLAWYTASILLREYGGVLSDIKTGKNYYDQNAIDHAKSVSNELENKVSTEDMKIYPFDGWK